MNYNTNDPGTHAAMRGGREAAALESMASYAAPNGRHYNHKTREELSRRFRAQRWAQRSVNRHLLPGTVCARCGRPVSKETGVGLYFDDHHKARFSGLRTCGSVWCCPVCNAKIQCARQKEIQQALETAKQRAYDVVFGTLTLRHSLTDSLDSVRAMCQKVWRSVMQQHGTRSLLSRHGLIGYLRAMEVTYSNANGWHCHFHVFFFFGPKDDLPWTPLSEDSVSRLQQDFSQRWISAVERVNRKNDIGEPFQAPLAQHQLFKLLQLSGKTIDTYSRYCSTRKSVALPGESAIWRAANEITNSQAKPGKVKQHDGRSVLHLNYWDFLSILSELKYGSVSYKASCTTDNSCYVRLVMKPKPQLIIHGSISSAPRRLQPLPMPRCLIRR